jgi:hypothetical protein
MPAVDAVVTGVEPAEAEVPAPAPTTPPVQASLIPAEPEQAPAPPRPAVPAPAAAASVNPFLRTQPAVFDVPKPLAPSAAPEELDAAVDVPKAPDWSLDGDREPNHPGDKPN